MIILKTQYEPDTETHKYTVIGILTYVHFDDIQSGKCMQSYSLKSLIFLSLSNSEGMLQCMTFFIHSFWFCIPHWLLHLFLIAINDFPLYFVNCTPWQKIFQKFQTLMSSVFYVTYQVFCIISIF